MKKIRIAIILLVVVSLYPLAIMIKPVIAQDAECPLNVIHIIQVTPALLCLQDSISSGNVTSGVTSVNAGTGIIVNQTTGNVLINATSVNATTGSNTDNTVDSDIIPVFKNHTGNTLFFRVFNNTLNDGITIFYNGTYIWLVNTAKESTVCNNTGSGVAICNGTGGNVNLNSLIGSGGIDVTNTGDDLTIAPRYELLCQNTLGSTATSISCDAFTARQHLYVNLNLLVEGSSLESGIRFNSDSGTNYARRISFNNGADSTSTSQTNCAIMGGNQFQADSSSIVNFWISNISAERKAVSGLVTTETGNGATGAPSRADFACEWDNTSSQITTITFIRNAGTGNYDTGTELTIWGYD